MEIDLISSFLIFSLLCSPFLSSPPLFSSPLLYSFNSFSFLFDCLSTQTFLLSSYPYRGEADDHAASVSLDRTILSSPSKFTRWNLIRPTGGRLLAYCSNNLTSKEGIQINCESSFGSSNCLIEMKGNVWEREFGNVRMTKYEGDA
jgi:hypothetical protein